MDIFESGAKERYSSADSLYEGLCDLAGTEIEIVADMSPDVSAERQWFYYTDKADKLKERYEELTEYGNNRWLMDAAFAQLSMAIDGENGTYIFDVHDMVYAVVINEDFQKRIGFKKWFVENQLRGSASHFKTVIEEWEEELKELNRFVFHDMCRTLYKALENNGEGRLGVFTYNSVAGFVRDKIQNMRLDAEVRFLSEARGHLFAYEDFIAGIQQNQALYNHQKQRFSEKLKELQAAFDERMNLLTSAAARVGLLDVLQGELNAAGIAEREILRIGEGE